MTEPLVSVLIRVRDEAALLTRTLNALRNQVLDADMEIVVLDNKSADGSDQVALERGAHVFSFPRALFGYGRALNLGIEMCRGRIVVLLSAHSIPKTDTWIADLIKPIREGAAGASFCSQVPPGPMTRIQLQRFAVFTSEPSVTDEAGFAKASVAGEDPYALALFSSSACAIQRDIALRFPFRDLPYSEDRAFVVDYVTAGGTVVYVPGTAVAYDQRRSVKGTYHAHRRCEVSRHLIREQAASLAGNRFNTRPGNCRILLQAALVLPAACRELATVLGEPRPLRREAIAQVPRTAAATLGIAMGMLRWRRYRDLSGRDTELMRQTREQCVPLSRGADAAQTGS
jgi:GT2 family glycosyltransferase